jgi:hypothetical protein
MASEDTIIAAKLNALEKELAKKELEERQDEEKREAQERADEEWDRQHEPGTYLAERGIALPTRKQLERHSRIQTLKGQVQLLQELKAQIEEQRTESQAQFLAMKKTAERSSRQGFWLTIGSSAVSLVLGWLLSLLTSPVGVLHAFGR